jgi:hypothetical protein
LSATRPGWGRYTVRVPPEIADLVQRRAIAHGITPSAAAAALLCEAAQVQVEHQHASLLEAAVERTIREVMAAHLGRIGELAFRGALHSDELRRQMRPLLAHLLGQETARTIRREAHSAAWQQLHEPLAAPPKHKDGAWPEAPGQS